jgi:hypothetical protein
MTTIKIEFQDGEVAAALNRLMQAGANPQPLLKSIGERVAETTRRRFETSTAPDGSRWKPNSALTYDRLPFGKRELGKSGRINAQGARRVMGKKPLVGETGLLSKIVWQLQGRDAVLVGSPARQGRQRNVHLDAGGALE